MFAIHQIIKLKFRNLVHIELLDVRCNKCICVIYQIIKLKFRNLVHIELANLRKICSNMIGTKNLFPDHDAVLLYFKRFLNRYLPSGLKYSILINWTSLFLKGWLVYLFIFILYSKELETSLFYFFFRFNKIRCFVYLMSFIIVLKYVPTFPLLI